MGWICPVCGTDNKEELICSRCQFDETRNYIRYRTLVPLSEHDRMLGLPGGKPEVRKPETDGPAEHKSETDGSANHRQTAVSRLRSPSIFTYATGYQYLNEEAKISGPVFLKEETKFITVRIFFTPPRQKCLGTLQWRIYDESGRAFSPVLRTQCMLTPSSYSMMHSYGWRQKGHWPVGVYKIVASINNSEPMETKFTVKPGKYDTAPELKLDKVRLFPSGNQVIPVRARRYAEQFPQNLVRYISFEIHFSGIRESVYTTINYKIMDAYKKVVDCSRKPVFLSASAEQCCIGYGSSSYGFWKRGKYTYQISIGESNIIEGRFRIC